MAEEEENRQEKPSLTPDSIHFRSEEVQEILPTKITLTTENLLVALAAKSSGRIDTLFVEEKQEIKEGSILAEIENAAVSTAYYYQFAPTEMANENFSM
ncbi:MAG: biotin/lipoyl-binding protein [Bacteroidales bacterium]